MEQLSNLFTIKHFLLSFVLKLYLRNLRRRDVTIVGYRCGFPVTHGIASWCMGLEQDGGQSDFYYFIFVALLCMFHCLLNCHRRPGSAFSHV
jgi:hypothetical protein